MSRRRLAQALFHQDQTDEAVYYYARIMESADSEPEVRTLLERAVESDGRFVHRRQAKEWIDQLPSDDQTEEPAQ